MWGWGSLRQRGEVGGSGHIDRQVVQSVEVVRDIQDGGSMCAVSCSVGAQFGPGKRFSKIQQQVVW